MTHDVLVVGAGFAGSVCAERLAAIGRSVLLIERRDHIAGNAFDPVDEHGLRIHRYGPHIFHTNVMRVVEYLSAFTEWRPYEHRVLASVDGALYPIPINRTTINRLYDLDLDEAGAAAFLERVRVPRDPLETSEDVVLNAVGRDLCDRFFRGYTRKQWNLDLSQLSPRVASRIPTRTNDDDRYFTDSFQCMPRHGYHEMFVRMLSSDRIDVQLGTSLADVPRWRERFEHVIYTGPVDELLDHRYGALPYRSLRFEHRHLPDTERFQPVGTVNYPNDHDYTRITEFKHLTGDQHPGTSIVYEYPQDEGDPYYPVPFEAGENRYRQYADDARAMSNVTLVGRLAQYKYLNMDQVVAAALNVASRFT